MRKIIIISRFNCGKLFYPIGGGSMKKEFKRIIVKVVILLCVLGGMGLKVGLLIANGDKDTDIYEPVSGENEVIPLNYHYIRERSLWNTTLDVTTQNKEITTYTVYEDAFIDQLDTLIEQGAYFATLEEVNEFVDKGEFPDKCVWISFDDADISVYKRAFPILKERNIPFTIFVIVGQVGSDDFSNLEICNWDELLEMKNSGLVSFGSHTYNMHYLEDDIPVFHHPHNHEKFYEDVLKSRLVLEEKLGVKVDSIAYPFGETNDDLTAIVKRAGFKKAYILAPHPINGQNDSYNINRYLLSRQNFDLIGLNNIGRNDDSTQK